MILPSECLDYAERLEAEIPSQSAREAQVTWNAAMALRLKAQETAA